jgi:hypothetical protein
MNKKDKLVEAINYNLFKLNTKGKKEYKAWFLYYFNMGAELINLLTEDQVLHCYIVIQDMTRRKELCNDKVNEEKR